MAKQKENLDIKDLEFDADGIHITDGIEATKTVTYSTGSLGLDILTGGFSPGVIQLWGGDGLGKTFLALAFGAEFQKAHEYDDCRVYLWATEGRWNPRLCKMIPNLKMEAATEKNSDKSPRAIFRVSRPKSGEKMYDFINKTIRQDKIKFFHIIDSNEGIKSEVNDGKTMSDAEKTASTATLNTKFLKEASVYLNHYGHVLLYTHQIRDKISQGPTKVSGVGKHHGGGHIIDHMSNLRLAYEKLWTDLYIFENPNDTHSRILGHLMKMKIEKTGNSGGSGAVAKVPLIYDQGIDREREIANLSIAHGLIQKNGAWLKKDGENIAQGEVKFIELLKTNKDLANELEKKIKEFHGIA